jgi:hypothetical protein
MEIEIEPNEPAVSAGKLQMKKKLVVHFGIHRTGTTSLQDLLCKNAENLKKQGILYPHLDARHQHSKISWGLISGRIDGAWLVQKLNDESDPSIETIILSHEDFCLVENDAWLRVLANEFELHAALYLRRQDAWLESWYNQHVKWPWDRKFSGCLPKFFLDHHAEFFWINYERLLQCISGVVDASNIYVNTIGDPGVKNTVTDFLRQYHINLELSPEDAIDKNASLTTAQLQILRRIDLGSLRANNKAKMKVLNALKKLEISEDDGSKIIFNNQQVNFILKEFEASNQAVARKYFNRENLFSDAVLPDRKPVHITDKRAYQFYIPKLLKDIAAM